MARPEKYNWVSIQEAYEKGFTRKEIIKKFNVDSKALSNRIISRKWKIIRSVEADIIEFKEKTDKISQNYANNPKIAELFEDRIATTVQDNVLIGNNRKLLKHFQSLILGGLKEKGMYETASDINIGVQAIKGIESVANPRTNKNEVNIQTNVKQESTILNQNIVRETLKDFDNEY